MLEARRSTTGTTPWAAPFRAADPHKVPIDSNGNLNSKTEGPESWTYSWNAENQLTKVEKSGAEVARFAYDPKGRRVEKVAGGVTTTYTYDREDVLREVRAGAVLKYVHSRDIDEPLAREDAPGMLTYYHADGLDSIVKRTNDAGATAHEYRYDAWGNIETGASESGFAFTGREWDPETGLYYYRARYYGPKGGRFISEDPIGLQAGINVYAYVEANPVNRTDPGGLYSFGPGYGVLPLPPQGPNPLPYPPNCGKPGACDYYEKLCASGDSYGCAAAPCCRSFGNDANANCVRQCLVDQDAMECSRLPSGRIKCRVRAHFVCYWTCGFAPRPFMPGSCYKVLIGG